MNSKKIERLLQIVSLCKVINKDIILSGSLALHVQGINLRNEPGDIDILLPFKSNFSGAFGELASETDESILRLESGYEDDNYYSRRSFLYGKYSDIKIDVFTVNNESILLDTCIYNSIKMLTKQEIIKFKFDHALCNASSKVKHQMDLIHILVNN